MRVSGKGRESTGRNRRSFKRRQRYVKNWTSRSARFPKRRERPCSCSVLERMRVCLFKCISCRRKENTGGTEVYVRARTHALGRRCQLHEQQPPS